MSKVSKLKTMIRKIVREEVAMAISEVVNELKQPSLSSQPMRKTSKTKSKKKIVEKKKFSNNSVLNDVLNETAAGDEWKTMGGGTYDSSKMEEVMSSQYGNMMQGEMDNSDIIAPQASPDVKNLFNKDYRLILKKSQEKRPSSR